jgi:hypothetical protein
MAQVDFSVVTDMKFVEWLNRIAARFNCTVEVDWRNHQVWFEGPEESKTALAIEINKYVY